MTTPTTTITSRVITVLQDADMTRWTLQELLDWGTEVQLQLVQKFPDAKTRTVTHQLVSGARQNLPEDAIVILDVRQNLDGAAVTPCERRALDLFYPKWMYTPTSDTVKHWMPDANPGYFYVYPSQGDTPATLVITHSAITLPMTASGNIDIRDIYVDRLVNGILARAFQKDAEFGGNAQRAVAYTQAAFG